MNSKLIVLFVLLLGTQGFFKNEAHKQKGADIVTQFIENFTKRYTTISFSGLDFIKEMELGFGYWITKITLGNSNDVEFLFDGETGIMELKTPQVHIDLQIEEDYNIPIKLTNFWFSVAITTTLDNIIIDGVQIDYENLSLDMNSVIEYLSRQLLSIDMVKKALKDSQSQLKGLFQNAVRNNKERLASLVQEINNKEMNTQEWVDFLEKVPFTTSSSDDYNLNIKFMLGKKTLRKDKQDDL